MQDPSKQGGPKTPKGKQISARNAVTHNMYSRTIVFTSEDRAKFRRILDGFTREHRPKTDSEMVYVHNMASHRWRNLRSMTLYKAKFEKAIDDQPLDLPPEDRAALALEQLVENKFMDALHREQVTTERGFTRALKDLFEVQDRREAKEKKNECICVCKQTNKTDLDAPVQ